MRLKRSTFWCVLFTIIRRMTSLNPTCPERHVIWETEELVAYLHPSPWTPGTTVLTQKKPGGPGSLFHMPEDSFLRLLLGARVVGDLLCERLAVRRCALLHRPSPGGGGAQLRILPLHGLEAEWRPHLAGEEDFQPYDPGYCSSCSGPRWTDSQLEQMKDRIRAKLPSPPPPANYSFLGEPSHPGLFSRIVRGEEPQWRVWEDDAHVAVLTPFPNTPGLTVLLPRKPLTSDILRLEEEDYRGMALATRKVARLLEEGLSTWGVGLIFEGFEIDYAHAKLIPLVQPPEDSPHSLTCPTAHFCATYPGYVTSVDGPPASLESLKEIHVKITRS